MDRRAEGRHRPGRSTSRGRRRGDDGGRRARFAIVIATGLHQPVGEPRCVRGVVRDAWRSGRGACRSGCARGSVHVTTSTSSGSAGGSGDRSSAPPSATRVIRWTGTGIGDLVLERAVPTGALRRTLSLTLADVEAPDRLLGDRPRPRPERARRRSTRPLAQRLDEGERVLWSARPQASRWTLAPRRDRGVGRARWRSPRRGSSRAPLLPSRACSARMRSPPVTAGVLVGGVALVVLLLASVASSSATRRSSDRGASRARRATS